MLNFQTSLLKTARELSQLISQDHFLIRCRLRQIPWEASQEVMQQVIHTRKTHHWENSTPVSSHHCCQNTYTNNLKGKPMASRPRDLRGEAKATAAEVCGGDCSCARRLGNRMRMKPWTKYYLWRPTLLYFTS